MPYIPQRFTGIALFVLAMLFFSAMNVTIGGLAGDVPPPQMVFVRNVFSFSMLLPFMLWKYGTEAMKTQRFGRHFQRAFIGLIAMETWFFSLSALSVNMATALSFTAPLFSTIFAIMLLGERIRLPRITALICGFAGVIVIINPTTDEALTPFTLVVLFSTAMMAYTGIIVKRLTVTEPGWRIVLYMAGLMSLLSFPPAFMVWQPLSWQDIGWLAMIGVFSTFAQLCLTNALKLEQIVVLMPFEFLRLIFTAALAWLAFAETITLNTVIGSVIIVCSAAFISWRESQKKRQHQQRNTTEIQQPI